MVNKIKSIYLRNKEIVVYLIVGVMTTIISLGVYYALVLTILNPNNAVQLQIANVTSWVVAVTFAYFANRKFVFKSKNKNMLKEGFKFCSSRIFTLLVDMLIMFDLVTILNLNDKLVKIIVQVVVTVLNYILSKFIVFKKVK